MAVKYQYLQTGEFYQGVPARDLTDEDFAALTPEAQEAVANSASVYRAVSTKEAKALAKEAAAAAPDPAPAPPVDDLTTG